MANTPSKSTTKCVMGPDIQFSYAHVFEAHASLPNQEPKYSVQLKIPKTNTEAKRKIDASVDSAIHLGKATWGGKIPSNLKTPLRDGDIERADDKSYKNCWFINASSKQRPGVVDADLNQIIDPSQFYSGCYGNASVNFFPYSVSGSKGIGCGLNNLQKIKDGEPLSGRSRPETDFSASDAEFLA